MGDKREPTLKPDLERTIGLRVRALREARGMSQAQLGHALGKFGFPMEQPTVYKLERGSRPLRVNELAALAAVLDVQLDHLLGSDLTREGTALQEYAVAARKLLQTEDRLQHARMQLAAAQREVVDLERAQKEALQEVTKALNAVQAAQRRHESDESADYYADQETDRMRGK